ncbi:MAG: hypothetical protein ABUL46_03720 [Chitinophaga rupis]
MSLEEFKSTLSNETPPTGIPASLAALWYDGKNDWEQAHTIAQDLPTKEGSWVHAYLHRKEGDTWNANYWYNRADRVMPDYSLEKEWEEMVKVLTGNSR